MIGKLTGRMDGIEDDGLLIDVGGVGYHVFCTRRMAMELPAGSHIVLYIDTHVREDHIHLYGFRTPQERAWFRVLTTVQGVGAKMALAVLDAFSLAQLAQAFIAQDEGLLTRVHGVGPKLARRMLAELKGKVEGIAAQGMQALSAEGPGAAHLQADGEDASVAEKTAPRASTAKSAPKKAVDEAAPMPPTQVGNPAVLEDATSALVHLGYGRSDAFAAASRAVVHSGVQATLEQIVKTALQELAA